MLKRILKKLLFPRRDPLVDIRALLKSTPVQGIADVGAHVGRMSSQFLATFPGAKVYAFEPHPDSFAQLRTLSDTSAGRLIAIQAAAGERKGTANFHLGTRPETSSLLPRPSEGKAYYPPDAVMIGQLAASVVSLDEWAAETNVRHLEVLKMDIQGGELSALKGAERLLRDTVRLVYTEVQFVPLYAGAPLYHDIAAHLSQRGYALYGFYDLVHAPDNQLVYGDALFVSTR